MRPAPAGETYQAWYLVDGQPTSAGLMSVGEDGYAILKGVRRLPGTDCWLLARRSVSSPDELAYYVSNAPQGTSLETLARVAATF